MIPETPTLAQATIDLLREQDALVQRARALFAWLDWSQVDQPRHCPGPHPHPESAYLKAFLLKIIHHLPYMTHLRTFLCDHPLLVLELGFRPVPDPSQFYGFDVQRTVPSDRWLREKLHRLDPMLLASLLEQTVHALQDAIPGLGEVVAFDVKHIYAWVRENNPREFMRDRFCKERQPKGDPDCRVGVKKSTNQEQPDGSKKVVKEYLWGYGSGVAAATDPVYGDVVLAEYTLPFNEGDVTYYRPLFQRTVIALNSFPLHVTADAAYDYWYVYETVAHGLGIAAIPLNTHGHEDVPHDPDGTPYCSRGLRMSPTYQFQHTNGFRAQRFRCPLLFPERTGETCEHEQFVTAKGCVKDPNWEQGGLMRVLLDRDGPLYHAVYTQRTACERINSQAQALGIDRPKVRNGRSVAHLNTLIYVVINVRALAKAQSINRRLLSIK